MLNTETPTLGLHVYVVTPGAELPPLSEGAVVVMRKAGESDSAVIERLRSTSIERWYGLAPVNPDVAVQ